MTTPALKLDPHNANRGTDRGRRAVADSLAECGAGRSILVDRDGTVIAGNKTLEAAQALGLPVRVVESSGDELVVVQRTDLELDGEDQRARRLAYLDNRAAQLGLDWDTDQILADLEAGVDLSGLWDDTELDELLQRVAGNDGLTDPDDVPAVPEEATTQPGDVWLLGDHRVMCGDSTDAGSVTLLMGGGLADFLFTSPPYNVGVAYGEHDHATAIWDDYGAFLSAVVRSWLPSLADGRVVGWNIGSSPKTFPHRQMALLEEAGCTYLRTMVWQKVGVPVPLWHNTRSNPVARNFHPNYTHEWVLLFSKGPLVKGGPVDPDELLEHDVFRLHQSDATRGLPDDPTAGYTGAQSNLSTPGRKVHPAPYPVRLPAMFASCLCDVGAVMADPFLGSGTTLIAAEQTGRVCYGMEIDPRYCDVIVRRWEEFTGRKAVLDGDEGHTQSS